MTLEWFKPDLLNSRDLADRPHWMDSWVHFVAELQSTFGPHDPIADAKHLLVLVISTSSYESITYYDDLPYLLPTCFSFIAAL